MTHKIVTRILSSAIVLVMIDAWLPVSAAVVDDMLGEFQSQTKHGADAVSGAALWNREFTSNDVPPQRSCNSCHTRDLHNTGKHIKTQKPIDPLAPSSNPERLTDRAKIEKWLKRNCKWTLGRECTTEEKADLLAYIRSQ